MSEIKLKEGTQKYSALAPWREHGVIADGSFGHAHVRNCLRILLQSSFGIDPIAELLERLREPMSDDASEEQEALDLLNEHAVEDGVHFDMVEGALMLLKDEAED